jgi:hypothetical protein
MSLKRLSLVTALALAVVAYAAVPASADILTPGQFGSVYSQCDGGVDPEPEDCPVKGVRSGAAPTLTAGSTVITCESATTNGVMDGDATAADDAAEAELNFAWETCTTQTGQGCTVDDITGVSVDITEANAPSSTIINTEAAGTTITCAGVFVCNASSDPSSTPVTAEVDQATQVATINDTVAVSGLLGCPLSGQGQWEAQYLITDDLDQSLDLWATGTL